MSAEPGFYLCIDSIGGGTGAVDKLKGAPLQDKEAILAFIGTEFRPYHLDADSGEVENDPLVIEPNEDAGDKRWILSSGVFAGLTLYGKAGIGTPTPREWIQVVSAWDDPRNQIGVAATEGGNINLACQGVNAANILFDTYYDSGWKSSSVDSNFRLVKAAHSLDIRVDTGVALGAAISWNVLAEFKTSGNLNLTGALEVDDTQVVGNRVIDARCDDAIDSGDATTDGVIDALRDAMINHGLIAASAP